MWSVARRGEQKKVNVVVFRSVLLSILLCEMKRDMSEESYKLMHTSEVFVVQQQARRSRKTG